MLLQPLGDTKLDRIKLKVTQRVLKQSSTKLNQRQIAVPNTDSKGLTQILSSAKKDNKIELRIDGRIHLLMGDTHAIWRSHNASDDGAQAFDELFEKLSQTPDKVHDFSCEVV